MRRFFAVIGIAAGLWAQQAKKPTADDYRRRNPVVQAPVAVKYVTALGSRLAGQIPGGASYTFEITGGRVAGDPTQAPAVFPGQIFVPAALFSTAESEAEFAGMLAQAVARGSSLPTRKMGGSASIAIGADPGFGGGLAGGNDVVSKSPGTGKAELEADSLAAQLLGSSALDPAALKRYLERVATPGASRDERIANLNKGLGGMTFPTPPSSPDFLAAQQEIRKLSPAKKH